MSVHIRIILEGFLQIGIVQIKRTFNNVMILFYFVPKFLFETIMNRWISILPNNTIYITNLKLMLFLEYEKWRYASRFVSPQDITPTFTKFAHKPKMPKQINLTCSAGCCDLQYQWLWQLLRLQVHIHLK